MHEVIIVGGGHAGVEAANILSKLKIKLVLITKSLENIGFLSCNPSMGGIGKSHLVREIDSLGGAIGIISTKSSLNLKKINISKGEAVSCTRSQICRKKFKQLTKKLLKIKNIEVVQDSVEKIIIKNNEVCGVKTNHKIYKSRIVIITTGTFLNSKIHIGLKKFKWGRFNENNSENLSKQLKLIIESNKFKTGTPPRISSKNIDFKNLKIQKGDFDPIPTLSSWYRKKKIKNYKNCWITKSKNNMVDIVKKNLKISPIYKNLISGISPRYCPSIEDKIYKFYNKKKHNIFLEPDDFDEYYLNGISTSLSFKEQINLVKSIKGLENCKITRFGYAVEYDFFLPKNLKKSFESKIIKGLFMAGQINGTTGYEEAAAQGIIAGINSYLKLKNKKYWYPNKKNSYIGLMINEITKKNVTEPYRIFTNKSDERLHLKEENSNLRLIKTSKILNLLNKKKINIFNKNNLFNILKNKIIFFNNLNIIKNIKIQLDIYFKYKNYIIKKNNIKKKFFIKNIKIKYDLNYFKVKNLPKEISEYLNYKKPKNVKELINLKKIKNTFLISIIKYMTLN